MSLSELALWLAGFAVVWGGTVGLVMLVRESNIQLAALGILVALVIGFFIVSEGFVANEHTSAQLTLIPDIGPGPYMSVVGVIAVLIGSVIGFAKRRVAASPTPAQPEPALPNWETLGAQRVANRSAHERTYGRVADASPPPGAAVRVASGESSIQPLTKRLPRSPGQVDARVVQTASDPATS